MFAETRHMANDIDVAILEYYLFVKSDGLKDYIRVGMIFLSLTSFYHSPGHRIVIPIVHAGSLTRERRMAETK